ncbi:MAG: signal recognition particle protein, partial [Thermodesulfobacteriota bacterium]
ELELRGSPAIIMLVGLQGSGKTTTTGKLAKLLKDKARSPYIVPADLQRPAAVLQLKRLSEEVGCDFHEIDEARKDVAGVVAEALKVAKVRAYDTMLVDTAGRLHVDEVLMAELKGVKDLLNPAETLFVADAMTGQDAVNTAKGFDDSIGITGVILSKLDGDARGGAALSMRMTTGKPIKFAGMGEKLDALEVFHPDRLAGRILDMGDVMTLIEKAGAVVDEKTAKELEKKIRKDTFTLQDFKDQIKQVKRMGSLDSVLSMIPGFSAIKKKKGMENIDERELVKVEAIIDSMTPRERRNPKILNAKRRKRIARGSGTRVQDINKLIKQYAEMRKMMKKFKKGGKGALKGMMQGGGGMPGGGGGMPGLH